MANWHTTTLLPTVEAIVSDGILAGTGSGALFVVSVSPASAGDDGGWAVIASGVFPTGQGTLVRVQDGGLLDALCYGGTPGDGAFSSSEDGTEIEFVVPPLPVGGPYDLYFESEDGLLTFTLAAALTVVKRSYADRLYSVRGQMPPPRDVGPYSIDQESGD